MPKYITITYMLFVVIFCSLSSLLVFFVDTTMSKWLPALWYKYIASRQQGMQDFFTSPILGMSVATCGFKFQPLECPAKLWINIYGGVYQSGRTENFDFWGPTPFDSISDSLTYCSGVLFWIMSLKLTLSSFLTKDVIMERLTSWFSSSHFTA